MAMLRSRAGKSRDSEVVEGRQPTAMDGRWSRVQITVVP